jgi:mRNA interferase MazF
VVITDFAGAGLPIPSIVRPAKLATANARDAQPLGKLEITDRQAVSDYLRRRLAAALA